EEKEKDEPKTKPREVTVEEFAPRQARDKNKKPEKKKRKKKESKFPKFWQDFSAEYKITWAVLGGLMVIGVGIGFFLPNDLKIIFLEQIFDKFSGLLEGVSTTWQLALSIFWNNLVVSFYLFMLGVTLIVPGLIILSNGLMIGIFFDYLVRLETMEPGILITSFVALLPHGIFEIPAFIMAAGLGTNLLIKLIFPKKFIKDKSRKRVLLDMVLRYAFIIIPLFFVAALVEAYLSPYVSNKVNDAFKNRAQTQYLSEDLPDKVELAKNSCTIISEQAIVPDDLSETSSIDQIRLIFDESTYRDLGRFSRVNKYSENYLCSNKLMQVRIWEIDDEGLKAYLDIQKEIFDGLDYSIEKIELGNEDETKGLFKLISGDNPYYFGYTKKSDNTYMFINYYGDDEELIKNFVTS
ncbi:MAG: stage II sporulation protein M, partial [Patescibacteria group bacterium]